MVAMWCLFIAFMGLACANVLLIKCPISRLIIVISFLKGLIDRQIVLQYIDVKMVNFVNVRYLFLLLS